MTRLQMSVLVGVLAVATALAQQPAPPAQPAPPPAPGQPGQPRFSIQPAPGGQAGRPAGAPEEGGLKGEAKLRWIISRLQLDENQTKQADALIQVYNAQIQEAEANKAEYLRRVQDKLAEIKAAQSENNQDRVKQLQSEIQAMTPTVAAENEFFSSLGQHLNDAQKARLPKVREQALRPNEAVLRPAHVLAVVHELKPTKEQTAKIEEVLDAYRKQIVAERPRDVAAMEARVEDLIGKLRAILTPEQQTQFDAKLGTLKADPPTALQMPPGAVVPAAPVPPPPAPPQPGGH